MEASTMPEGFELVPGVLGNGTGLCRSDEGWPAFINLRVFDLDTCAEICNNIGGSTEAKDKFECQAMAHSAHEFDFFPDYEDCVLYATVDKCDLKAGKAAIEKLDLKDKHGNTKKYEKGDFGGPPKNSGKTITTTTLDGAGGWYTCYKKL